MEFLRDAWSMAAWAEELRPGEPLGRTLTGRPVVVLRRADGEVVALDDRCPHRFAPLSRGRVTGDRFICGYHGLEFDTAGRCVRNPHGQGRIPAGATVRSHPVVERYGAVWVWTGRPDAADPDLVPPLGPPDGGDLPMTRRDHFVMDVPYELIVDNLLDCSHVSFLHPGILGNPEMLTTGTDVRQDGDAVTITRLSRAVPPPGMFDMLYTGDGSPVDTWTEICWQAPATIWLDTGVTGPGRARHDGTGYFGLHVLTPETPTTTHYFTAARRWGVRDGTDTADMQVRISDLRRFAFEEQDEPMIRAQHRVMTLSDPDELVPVLLETDGGVVRWRRIMQRLVDDQGRARPRSTTVRAVVSAVTDDGTDVRRFRLEPAGPDPLPVADAGAHVDVHLPGGLVRQYSLCAVPDGAYTLAVKREEPSRGGSRAMHALRVGDELRLGPVRNSFPLHPDASHHLLLAAGIGVTPLLAMAGALQDRGQPFALHHFVRSPAHALFADVLSAATELHTGLDPVATATVLTGLLAAREPGSHVYACGPAPFLDAVTDLAAHLCWPDDAVHVERFTAAPGRRDGTDLEVTLARSGRTVAVTSDETLLAGLRRHGVEVPSSCEQGVCGTCVTRVLGGVPDHRDSYLTPDERAAGDRMCVCVSRAHAGKLVLDL